MKTLIIKNANEGQRTEIIAQKVYEESVGHWVAEVDGTEYNRACDIFCRDIEGCKCEDMHGQADIDDDGKEYRIKNTA